MLKCVYKSPPIENAKKHTDSNVASVWRLICPGPNNDWPLGLCDWRTVDIEDDIIDNDVVFEGNATENTLLYYNRKHQWYWKSDMGMDDVIVLCNASSDGRLRARAFHTAFEVPQYSPDIKDLRHSIEVRVAAFLR
ncbi:hypothetical protein BKA63DRAFT_555283 [Paraphoma chrysanthemicola]|nr:hypothetical protein BKA63DRAFT_555283 [Paraphoma chrysanthemicola]